MTVCYNKLWKLLIDKDMSKKELMENTGVSKSTINKMAHGEDVSLDVIDRICTFLNCNVECVVEHIKD